jgi:hypothetical protein
VKRYLLPLTTLLACAGAAAAIVAIAVSSASGTPGGSELATPRPSGGSPPAHVAIPPCRLAASGGASDITVSGACTGRLTETFACARNGGLFALSVRRPLAGRNVFYLTIVIPDFVGPGGYPEAEAFGQIVGPPNTPRWTDRDVAVRLDPTGSAEVARTLLHAEPGTPATGRIILLGHAACSG